MIVAAMSSFASPARRFAGGLGESGVLQGDLQFLECLPRQVARPLGDHLQRG